MYPHQYHRTDQPILDVSHLTIAYEGQNALDDVSFHLHAGERIAVVGPNGAGKSTLFKAIAGVLSPTSGHVQVYGSKPGVHVCIAYLPQRSHVDWRFPVSVADVVMMGRIAKMGLFGWPKKADRDSVEEALEIVGMKDLGKRQIGQLSGGQQQRMFIARAITQQAELMLMDEPLTGLDVPSQDGILALLKGMQVKNITVMVATHDLEQAAKHFDRIMLINRKLVSFGRGEDVLTTEVLTQVYGGKVNITDGKNLTVTDTCCEGDEDDTAN